MNQTLVDFEATIELGPTYAARLLGVAYPTYAQYRSERRPLPLYHERHIAALLALSQRNLDLMKKEHAYGHG